MGCNTCKKKPANKITTLQSVESDKLKLAYEYTRRMTQMNDEKWDVVEEVYISLFGQKTLNRNCADCMRNVIKAIEHEYNKIIKK